MKRQSFTFPSKFSLWDGFNHRILGERTAYLFIVWSEFRYSRISRFILVYTAGAIWVSGHRAEQPPNRHVTQPAERNTRSGRQVAGLPL